MRAPVLYGAEAFLVGDVVHKYKAHGSSIIGGGDGSVPLLTGGVPYLRREAKRGNIEGEKNVIAPIEMDRNREKS